jgi:LysM repeat protein
MIALVAAAAIAAACGGSGEEGDGERITDPAKVPTSAPLQNATLYQVRGAEFVSSTGASPAAAAATRGPTTYTIQSGDTCPAIAAKTGVSVDDLRRTNREINADCTNLIAGQTLRIPVASAGSAATATPKPGTGATSGRTHTVVAGDNCWDIAQRYGVTVAALTARNGLSADCRELQLGQTLTIP